MLRIWPCSRSRSCGIFYNGGYRTIRFSPFCHSATDQVRTTSNANDDAVSAVSTASSLAKVREENRILPQKYKPPERDAIIRQSRLEIQQQIARGGKPRMPFRLWRMIFAECNNYTFEQFLNLSPEECLVHAAHWRAMQERKLTYKDPYTKSEVMTTAALWLRGECCGNGCRHCPYDHANAPEDLRKKKKWNGAYYV